MRATRHLLLVFCIIAVTQLISTAGSPPQDKKFNDYIPKPADLMKMLIDNNGPLSNWISYKSDITVEDITQFKHLARRDQKPLTPLIIIPSLVGSVLVATLTDFKSNYFFCPKTWSTPFYLWLDNSSGFLFYVSCWIEHMTLQFNSSTNFSSNAQGISVDTLDYGGVGGVEYLDPGHTIGLWNDTISVLQAVGYEVGKNLRAAPYDWRFGPIEYMKYDFPRLKKLVEETYTMNGNTPVSFVSLSMGGPYFLSFLNNAVSQEWKDKYVNSFYSLDGAFGGCVSAPIGLSNYNFLSQYVSPLLSPFGTIFRTMLQSMPSFIWMFPVEQYLGVGNVTVTTGTKGNYSTDSWPELLIAAGATNSAQIMTDMIQQNMTTFSAPGVRTYCIYGYGLPTLQKVAFETDFNSPYKTSMADGDITVLYDGLDICAKFQSQQKQNMTSYPVKGMQHGSSVHNKEVLGYFVRSLLNN